MVWCGVCGGEGGEEVVMVGVAWWCGWCRCGVFFFNFFRFLTFPVVSFKLQLITCNLQVTIDNLFAFLCSILSYNFVTLLGFSVVICNL